MNRTRQCLGLGFAPVLLFATAAGGQATPSQGNGEQAAEPQVAVRLHFEVLELNLTPEQVERMDRSTGLIDTEALAAETIKAGNARVKHVFDSPLIVGEAVRLITGARVPIAQGSSVSKAGVRGTTVTYEDIGCILECSTRWVGPPDARRMAVSCEVEVSDLAQDPSVMLTKDLPAPVFIETGQHFSTIVELGVACSFSSLSSQPANSTGNAGARSYLYRLRLDELPGAQAAPQKKSAEAPGR